ncbi:GT99 family glycosyltransferase N-terminal domain-containing protein [Pseudomonas sp. NY15435]|uniref:GT99 family glycosyltransferase N-terminal domain-containing protein n=1 Tax=Pseudomonas sp. NY15435 TaxID=3400358 RepID=UPI003A8B20BB
MLTIFLPPYPFRGIEAPYLWVFYKFLSEAKEPLHFLTGKSYLQPSEHFTLQNRWELDPETCQKLKYAAPTADDISRHSFTFLDHRIFEELLKLHSGNPLAAFRAFLCERIPLLERELDSALADSQAEAIISWVNCPSLKAVAEKYGIPVIHSEIGPLRSPIYRDTGYLDFSGVNGNTEAEIRYSNIAANLNSDAFDLFGVRHFFLNIPRTLNVSEAKYLGLPLQVEDDSNLIAYGNDFDNQGLMAFATLKEHAENLLIRPHPSSLFTAKSSRILVDESPNSIEFMRKCRALITINSSLGIEALLFEKPVQALGDASYSFILSAESQEETANRLSFYLFCYLVPLTEIYNSEYIRFRLSNPKEVEILHWHLRTYGISVSENLTLSEMMLKGIEQQMSNMTAKANIELSAENEKLRIELHQKEDGFSRALDEKAEIAAALEKSKEEIEKALKSRDEILLLLESKDEELSRALDKKDNKIIALSVDLGRYIEKQEELEKRLSQFQVEINQERARTAELLTSASWRVTSPLRAVRRILSTIILRLPAYRQKLKYAAKTIADDPQVLRRAFRHLLKNGLKDTISQSRRALQYRYAPATTPTMAAIRLSRQETTFILSTEHCIFVAEQIKRNLQAAGFPSEIIFQEPEGGFSSSLHFVICPQIFKSLPGLYVAFQMEQSVSSRWFTNDYLQMLENSFAIFDYSLTNVKYLQENGLTLRQIYYTPISYIPDYYSAEKPAKEYDILFYGDANNERRKDYLNVLSKKYKTKIINNIFGEELYQEIAKARLVVNIHYYEGALLETTRLYECLSLGAMLISESSPDVDENGQLQELIDFVAVGDIEAMTRRIDHWLENPADLVAKTKQNEEILRSSPNSFNYYFNRFLLASDNISFDEFYDLAGHNIEFRKDLVCLGLPESTERKADFENDNSEGFQYFPGLRHNVGWIGCGLSYKFIIRKAYEQQFDKITVCEDDVDFLPGWKARFDEIHSHLKNDEKPWDIFSGLIANLHEETNVKALDDFEDFELIHIDKMTSTVLNTYNARSFPKILGWDENNRNPASNTIDRFIEKQSGVDIITTFPFLVGHKEEMSSTLWGFKNTQYRDMIAASAALLRQKADAFKKK